MNQSIVSTTMINDAAYAVSRRRNINMGPRWEEFLVDFTDEILQRLSNGNGIVWRMTTDDGYVGFFNNVPHNTLEHHVAPLFESADMTELMKENERLSSHKDSWKSECLADHEIMKNLAFENSKLKDDIIEDQLQIERLISINQTLAAELIEKDSCISQRTNQCDSLRYQCVDRGVVIDEYKNMVEMKNKEISSLKDKLDRAENMILAVFAMS